MIDVEVYHNDINIGHIQMKHTDKCIKVIIESNYNNYKRYGYIKQMYDIEFKIGYTLLSYKRVLIDNYKRYIKVNELEQVVDELIKNINTDNSIINLVSLCDTYVNGIYIPEDDITESIDDTLYDAFVTEELAIVCEVEDEVIKLFDITISHINDDYTVMIVPYRTENNFAKPISVSGKLKGFDSEYSLYRNYNKPNIIQLLAHTYMIKGQETMYCKE